MYIYQSTLEYYVYAYLREDGTPYYIGKGKGDRAWKSHKNRGIYKPNRKRITICESNLTEIGALALERRLIRWYGRKNNNTGILRNKTDGGDGTSGVVRSQETIKRMSEAQRGKKTSEHTKKILSKMRKGVSKSEEHKRKISASNKGIKPWNGNPISEETRLKMSLAHKGKKRKPFSQEHKERIRQARLREEVTCPVCNKTMNCGNFVRYNHGPKCRQKS